MSAKTKKVKPVARPVSTTRQSQSFNILDRIFRLMEILAESSVSNVVNGVIVSLWINDMLLKGKLISTAADINTTILANLNAGTNIFTQIFGKSSGTGLTSLVRQDSNREDRGKKDAQADIGGVAQQLGQTAFLEAALAALV